jgi:hypothetical protein
LRKILYGKFAWKILAVYLFARRGVVNNRPAALAMITTKNSALKLKKIVGAIIRPDVAPPPNPRRPVIWSCCRR